MLRIDKKKLVAKNNTSAWIILPETHMLSPIDAFAFRNIVLICMSVGLFSCIGYQAILKIPSSQVINQLPTIDILQPSKCKLIPVSGLELCSPHCFTNSQFPNVQNF